MKKQGLISKSLMAAGLYSVLGLLPSLIAVFTLPIYLNHLSVADYGALSLLLFYGNFFGMVAILQLNAGASITYFDQVGDNRQLQYFKSTIFTSAIVIGSINFLLFTLIGHLFFDEFLSNAQVSFHKEGLMVMGGALLNQIQTIYLMYQRNAYKLRSFMGFTVTSLILTVALQYLLIVERQMGITGSVLGTLIASAVITLMIVASNKTLLNFRVDRSLLVPTLRFAIPLIPMVFLEWFFSAGTRLFVEKLMTLEDVGKISLVVTFMLVANKIFSSIWSGFSPELLGLLKDQGPSSYSRLRQLVSTYLRLGLLVLSGTLMLGSNLLLITDNPQFLAVVPLFPLVIVALIPKMLTSVPTLKLMSEKKSTLISMIMAISTSILIIGFLTMIPPLGLKGILLSFLIANLINLLIRSWNCGEFSFQVLFKSNGLLILGVFLFVYGLYELFMYFKLKHSLFGIFQFGLVLAFLGYLSRKELVDLWAKLRPFLVTLSSQKPSR